MIHALIALVIILCIVGVLLWIVQQIPGIPPIVKTVVIGVAAILILLWILNSLGGFGFGTDLNIHR